MLNMDGLFLKFFRGLFIMMTLFGVGMVVVILAGDNDTIGLRMVNVFASMFLGVLGLGSGYLLGRYEQKTNRKEAG